MDSCVLSIILQDFCHFRIASSFSLNWNSLVFEKKHLYLWISYAKLGITDQGKLYILYKKS